MPDTDQAVNTAEIGVQMNDNVIPFPRRIPLDGDESSRLPSSVEEVQSAKENIRHIYINEITEVVVSTIIQQLMAAGFNILDDAHKKDFGFLIETVRSSMCTTIDLYHPIQDVAEEIMKELDDDVGTLVIADSINVKFKNDENADKNLPSPEDVVEAT